MTQPSPQSAEAQAAMTVAECADQLRQRHPALFDGPPKPVKLRIQHDIQERNPGVFSKQTLAAFFRRYTNSGAYLKAIVRGTHRYDLDGQPAGEISDEHRQVAETALKERQARIDAQRAEERAKAREQERAADHERLQRAALLRDFETTTLTRENFCALKGVPFDQLDVLLATARQEKTERADYLKQLLSDFQASGLDVPGYAARQRMHPAQVDRLLREARGPVRDPREARDNRDPRGAGRPSSRPDRGPRGESGERRNSDRPRGGRPGGSRHEGKR